MLALAGARLDVRFRFLDPAADACAGDVGELLVGSYDDPELLDRLAEGADAVTYEFENVPVEAARRVGAVPDARALEHGQDRLAEKELFRSLGIPTARYGSRRGRRRSRAREVPAARLRRQGPARGRVGRARSARTSSPRRSSRSTASCRSSRCAARDGETALLPARGERAPGRDSRDLAGAGAGRAAGGGGGDRHEAPRRARLRRRAGGRAVRGRRRGCSRTSSRRASTTPGTGRSTAPSTSQFENHVRAVLGMPLGSTEALGESRHGEPRRRRAAARAPARSSGAHVHLYGKTPRAGRKLGHVTLVDASRTNVREVEELAASAWRARGSRRPRAGSRPSRRIPTARRARAE